MRTQTIKIDAAAPTAQISSPDRRRDAAAGDVTVKVDATDAGSGIADVELFVDGDYVDYSGRRARPTSSRSPAGTLSLGTHRIKALVDRRLGNRTWTLTVTFTLKDGLPDDHDRL